MPSITITVTKLLHSIYTRLKKVDPNFPLDVYIVKHSKSTHVSQVGAEGASLGGESEYVAHWYKYHGIAMHASNSRWFFGYQYYHTAFVRGNPSHEKLDSLNCNFVKPS